MTLRLLLRRILIALGLTRGFQRPGRNRKSSRPPRP